MRRNCPPPDISFTGVENQIQDGLLEQSAIDVNFRNVDGQEVVRLECLPSAIVAGQFRELLSIIPKVAWVQEELPWAA